jgi:hypothetical protein
LLWWHWYWWCRCRHEDGRWAFFIIKNARAFMIVILRC